MTARSDLSRSEGKSEGLSESGKTSDTLDIEGVLAEAIEDALSEEYGTFLDGGTPSGVAHSISAHVAAVLREQIAEWLGSEALTVFSASGCTCPSSAAFGMRFHRHPCPRAGEIESRVPSTSEGEGT